LQTLFKVGLSVISTGSGTLCDRFVVIVILVIACVVAIWLVMRL
jgi:hypothetical protein